MGGGAAQDATLLSCSLSSLCTLAFSGRTACYMVGLGLLELGLIAVESSSYFDKRGMKWKGNNLYTILPMRAANFSSLQLSTGVPSSLTSFLAARLSRYLFTVLAVIWTPAAISFRMGSLVKL